MIKAVTFDLGNTLLRQDNLDWKKLEKAGFLNHINIFVKQNLSYPTLKEWSGRYYEITSAFEQSAGKHDLEVPAEKIFHVLREHFRIPSVISTSMLLSTFFIPLMNARLLMDHAADALQELHDRKIRCGVISNSVVPGYLGREVLERLGILKYFEFTLFSSDCVFAKPHPQMFQTAAAAMDLRPSQIFHVGDQLDKDVVGAKKAGMRTVWLNRDRKKIRKDRIRPDHEIHSLDQLTELLKKA